MCDVLQKRNCHRKSCVDHKHKELVSGAGVYVDLLI